MAEAVRSPQQDKPGESGYDEPTPGPRSARGRVGATVPDASIPATVLLDFVGWRSGDAGIGSPGRSTVYLHVYDSFGITPGGAIDPAELGNLLAVSLNSNDSLA